MSRDGILLLGGGGFIGCALARRLTEDRREVHILGRRDADLIPRLLPRCGTVVHLASTSTPGSSARRPTLELDNLAPALHLLETLQAHPETHLIFFSSGGTIYGNPAGLPVGEDAQLAPLSCHGAGKAALEAFLHAFRAQGHAVTILRPSNAYGPGQPLRGGFGLIRTLLEHARAGTAMEIWGDGENVRDFIYIDDVAEACARFVDLPQDSGTYNLGSGTGHSVNEVRHLVEKVCGTRLEAIFRPARGIDVRGVVLDVSRIEARLSWRPIVGLEEGIRRTWAWLLAQ